jgi:hypothetical protein
MKKIYVVNKLVYNLLKEPRVTNAIFNTILENDDLYDKYMELLLTDISDTPSTMDDEEIFFNDLSKKQIKDLAKKVIKN